MANCKLSEFLQKYRSLQNKVSLACGEYAKEVLAETIEEEIYKGDFQPNYYIRRYNNGGYGDRRNIRVRLVKDGLVYVENITRGIGDTNNRIDNIIESGEGYTWNRQPPPRPVFAITKAKLRRDPNLIRIAKEVINKEGFKIK